MGQVTNTQVVIPSYGLTQYGATSFHGNEFGLQYVGTVRLSYKNTSFSLSNDLFGDKEDRWRTSAAELTIGKFSVGSYILTNWGKNDSPKIDDSKFTRNVEEPYVGRHVDRKDDYGRWNNGQVFSSPLWFGYKYHSMDTQVGFSNRIIQSYTQNFVHKFMHTPYFMDYDNIRE